MSQQQHITKDGPKDCNAAPGNCPLQNAARERGEDIPHFPTKKAAKEAWAQMLAEEHADDVHTSLKQSSLKKPKPTKDAMALTVEDVHEQFPEGIYNNGKIFTGTLISGTIDPSTLNSESYKQFGFEQHTARELIQIRSGGFSYDHDTEDEPDDDEQIGIPTEEDYDGPCYTTYVSQLETKGLTEGERNVVYDYTMDLYQPINEYFFGNTDYLEPDPDVINTLDNVIAKAPFNHQKMVYRGATNEVFLDGQRKYEEWATNNREIGTVVQFDGYTSSSYSQSQALRFAKASVHGVPKAAVRHNVMYEMLTPEGISLESVTHVEGEEELLLPRQQRYVVVGKYDTDIFTDGWKKEKSQFHVIQMVAVNEKNEILGGNVRSPKPAPLELED